VLKLPVIADGINIAFTLINKFIKRIKIILERAI
jgi:hypothetical protein